MGVKQGSPLTDRGGAGAGGAKVGVLLADVGPKVDWGPAMWEEGVEGFVEKCGGNRELLEVSFSAIFSSVDQSFVGFPGASSGRVTISKSPSSPFSLSAFSVSEVPAETFEGDLEALTSFSMKLAGSSSS